MIEKSCEAAEVCKDNITGILSGDGAQLINADIFDLEKFKMFTKGFIAAAKDSLNDLEIELLPFFFWLITSKSLTFLYQPFDLSLI